MRCGTGGPASCVKLRGCSRTYSKGKRAAERAITGGGQKGKIGGMLAARLTGVEGGDDGGGTDNRFKPLYRARGTRAQDEPGRWLAHGVMQMPP
jgi:hypothetical protein